MDTREDAIGVITNALLFSWFAGVADPDEIGEDDIHADDQDALKEWLAAEDGGGEAARHAAVKIIQALDDAGIVLARGAG